LALADSVSGLAEPHDTLLRVNRNEDLRRLRELVRDHGVRRVLVGLPLRLDGTRGEMAEEATRFAKRLERQLGLAVEMVDERLTSWEAERILEEEWGRPVRHKPTHARGKRSGRSGERCYSVDAVAALLLLRDYLARSPRPEEGG